MRILLDMQIVNDSWVTEKLRKHQPYYLYLNDLETLIYKIKESFYSILYKIKNERVKRLKNKVRSWPLRNTL